MIRIPSGPEASRLLGLALAHPAHRCTQQDLRAFAARVFAGQLPRLERLLDVFGRALIEERHLALPLEAYTRTTDLAERNRTFQTVASGLAEQAAAAALADAGVAARDVTHVVTVTSTGFATPTLETLWGPRIGLPATAKRLPLWGLGCAGGASGLALASELAEDPRRRVLLVAVELCSLTFVREDYSESNLVATALFADGAAAAVVARSREAGGLALGTHREELLERSRGVMGWDLTARGLQVVFLRRIPGLVATSYRGTVERALRPHGLTVEDLVCLATHPGGRKVIEQQEAALGLGAGALTAARDALRRFGNVSSVSVFQVLEGLRAAGCWGRPGILSAFGPGFTSHVMALPGG